MSFRILSLRDKIEWLYDKVCCMMKDQANYVDTKVNSVLLSEPTGSDRVLNIVSLTQAEYDAETPIATTFYIITDA
jgi:hypothetical protein